MALKEIFVNKLFFIFYANTSDIPSKKVKPLLKYSSKVRKNNVSKFLPCGNIELKFFTIS